MEEDVREGENKTGNGRQGDEKSKNDVTKGTKIRKKMTSHKEPRKSKNDVTHNDVNMTSP